MSQIQSRRKQRWTPQELEIATQLRASGLKYKEIAARMERSVSAVQQMAVDAGAARTNAVWSSEELLIVETAERGGTAAIRSALAGAGYVRSMNAIRTVMKRVRREREFLWEYAVSLSQPLFFAELDRRFRLATGSKLTYPELSALSLYSLSRIQKWFTPGSAQEPLAITTRHHLWLLAKSWMAA